MLRLLQPIRRIHLAPVLRLGAPVNATEIRKALKFEFSKDNQRRVKALLAWYPQAEWKEHSCHYWILPSGSRDGFRSVPFRPWPRPSR